MRELRASNNTPQPVIDELIRVFTSLGISASDVAQDGWHYNPKTGYLRFETFVPDGSGGFVMGDGDRVTVRRVRKLKPFWRKRLESVFELYKDEHVPKVPR